MAAQKSGKIVNIGSIAGVVGRDREMYHRDVCEFYEVHKFMFPDGIIHVNEFPEFSKNELKNKVRNFKRKNQVA